MSAIEIVVGRQILDSRATPPWKPKCISSPALSGAPHPFGRVDGHARSRRAARRR